MTERLTARVLRVVDAHKNEVTTSNRNESERMSLIKNSLTCPFKFLRDNGVVF